MFLMMSRSAWMLVSGVFEQICISRSPWQRLGVERVVGKLRHALEMRRLRAGKPEALVEQRRAERDRHRQIAGRDHRARAGRNRAAGNFGSISGAGPPCVRNAMRSVSVRNSRSRSLARRRRARRTRRRGRPAGAASSRPPGGGHRRAAALSRPDRAAPRSLAAPRRSARRRQARRRRPPPASAEAEQHAAAIGEAGRASPGVVVLAGSFVHAPLLVHQLRPRAPRTSARSSASVVVGFCRAVRSSWLSSSYGSKRRPRVLYLASVASTVGEIVVERCRSAAGRPSRSAAGSRSTIFFAPSTLAWKSAEVGAAVAIVLAAILPATSCR